MSRCADWGISAVGAKTFHIAVLICSELSEPVRLAKSPVATHCRAAESDFMRFPNPKR
jgi:hypothetical protein